MLLLASKFFVAWWITLMSAIGVWLPIFYVHRHREEPLVGAIAFTRGKKTSAIASSATTKWYLSLANCASAGMLLTMALMHFFPESLEVTVSGSPHASIRLCFWMLVGILIPALLGRSLKGGGGHSHGVASESDGSHLHGEAGGGGGGSMLTSTLLIVLMCFHGMTEGLLLGFEDKISDLLSATLPLSIHKFCDGLVIGVTMAKEVSTQPGEETPGAPTADSDATRSPTRFWQRLYQGPVGVWLLFTPVTMICVVLFAATVITYSDSVINNTSNISFSTSRPVVQMPPSTATGGGTVGAVSTLAAVQAMGSGSFVYIGLEILSGEGLKGASANAALLAGVALTAGLFLVSSDGH